MTDIKQACADIAVEVAKNCGSMPQLTFPHIYLGVLRIVRDCPEEIAQLRPHPQLAAVEEQTRPDDCGACGDACQSRGSCRLRDESPTMALAVPDGRGLSIKQADLLKQEVNTIACLTAKRERYAQAIRVKRIINALIAAAPEVAR